MKKIITLIFFCIGLVQSIWAQDVIVTRQSERIDAKILEVSETEIRYKKQNNLDGPTFVLSTDKVASILYSNGDVQSFTAVSHKEEPQRSTTTAPSKLYNGIEVSVNPLMAIYLGQGGGVSFCADAGFGRRFNNNFYWGMNVGGAFASDYKAFSFGTTARAYFPLNSPMDYYVDVYAGTETDFDNWRFCARLMPGIQIPLSPSVDFRFSTGYMGRFGEISLSYLALGASFAFHGFTQGFASSEGGSNRLETAKAPKPEEPPLESGLQFGIEATGIRQILPTLTLGYKVNSHLTLSLGASLGIWESFDILDNIERTFTSSFTNKSANLNFSTEIYQRLQDENFRFFLRGVYRLTDNKFSPMVGLDLGVKEVNYLAYDNVSNMYGVSIFKESSTLALSVSPALGVSWRMASNSYLELKAGWNADLYFFNDRFDCTRYLSGYGDVLWEGTTGDNWFTTRFFVSLGYSQTLDMVKVKNFFGL